MERIYNVDWIKDSIVGNLERNFGCTLDEATEEQIYQAVWKEEPVDVSSSVFCIIRNIRQKLRKVTKKEYIQTVWGVGYKFVDVPGE